MLKKLIINIIILLPLLAILFVLFSGFYSLSPNEFFILVGFFLIGIILQYIFKDGKKG